MLPGHVTAAIRFDDPKGKHVQVVLTDTGNTGLVYSVAVDEPRNVTPLGGEQRGLLPTWTHRLRLTFDPLGRIVPIDPVPMVGQGERPK